MHDRTRVHVLSDAEAAAAVAASVKAISCRPYHSLVPIQAAAPNAVISAGFPNGSVSPQREAIRNGFAKLARGANAVHCSCSTQFVEATAREGIQVTGRQVLVPNHAAWTSFRAVGRTPKRNLVARTRWLRDQGWYGSRRRRRAGPRR